MNFIKKIEYYCPKCKKVVDYDDTMGQAEAGVITGILRRQEWPKTSRYHKKCGTPLVEFIAKR